MQEGRKVENIINNNDNSIQRRVNLMGQELANVGISDVSVEVTIKIKGSDSGGSFEKVRTGKFAKFVKGNGPGKIGGIDDNAKPTDLAKTKTIQRPSVFSSTPNDSGLNADGN